MWLPVHQQKFYLYQVLSIVAVLGNLLLALSYYLGVGQVANTPLIDIFTLPFLSFLVLLLSLVLVSKPHFLQFPQSLVAALMRKDYLEKIYVLIRRQILVVAVLLQILIAYVNWGTLNNAFVDPVSLASYLMWLLISAVLVTTFYYVFLLWQEAMNLGLIKKTT